MPDWLIQVVVQYPIVAMVGFVAWYAHREMKRQQERFLAREHERQARAEARYDELRHELVKSKEEATELVTSLLRTELKRLNKSVDELTKRLGG